METLKNRKEHYDYQTGYQFPWCHDMSHSILTGGDRIYFSCSLKRKIKQQFWRTKSCSKTQKHLDLNPSQNCVLQDEILLGLRLHNILRQNATVLWWNFSKLSFILQITVMATQLYIQSKRGKMEDIKLAKPNLSWGWVLVGVLAVVFQSTQCRAKHWWRRADTMTHTIV